MQPESRAERRRAAEVADIEMERFRVEVGQSHGVKTENLVDAIANEAGLDSEFIGRVDIVERHSTVELPAGMPKFLLKDLEKVWVCNHQLNITRLSQSGSDMQGDGGGGASAAPRSKPRKPRTPADANRTKRSNSSQTSAEPVLATADKREKKKKERHRNKKAKGKRTP